MRKLPLILGLVLLVLLTIHDTREFFATDEGVGYFTSHPNRLLYVVGVGVSAGLLALAFSRLSPTARRTLRLTTLGGFGTCITALLCIFATRLSSSSSQITDSGTWSWIVVVLASLSVISVLVWLEFYFVWRQREDTVGDQ
jgi:uncharacterized protein involved in response to NO